MSSIPVAGKFISTIIGEEVIELSSVPVKRKSTDDENTDDKKYVVTRSSFIARIRTGEKVKDVMIKVYEVSPIFNNALFIRYLEIRNQNRKPESGNKDRETYCIVILPDGIGIKDMPVVKVNVHSDELPNELSDESIQLLKQLRHRSWIIQVPELNSSRRRNSVEVLLSIFDQTRRKKNNNIFLNNIFLYIYEEDFPEEYHPVIRRLERAASSDAICDNVRMEDYLLEHLRIMKRKKDIIIAQKEATIAELAEKEAAIARELAEKEAVLAALKAKSNTEK
jgi:hypothetical protein